MDEPFLSGSLDDPPPEFKCPVTLGLLVDPVIAADGITYEREMLEQVVAAAIAEGERARLPMSRLPFRLENIVPNLALRDAVNRWRDAHGVVAPARPGPIPSPFGESATPGSSRAASPIPPPPRHAPPATPSPVHIVFVLETSKRLMANAELHHDVLAQLAEAMEALFAIDIDNRVSLVSFGSRGDVLMRTERPSQVRLRQVMEMVHYDTRVDLSSGLNRAARCAHETDLETLVVVLSCSRPTKGPPPEFVLSMSGLRYSRVVPVLLGEEAQAERWWRAPRIWGDDVLVGMVTAFTEQHVR